MQQWSEMTERAIPTRESEGVAPQISRVWSCNEWDPRLCVARQGVRTR
jgi:hypothetical protein